MRLLLHIGTEKTGTTSLQQWLHKNADTLQEQGVFYSRVLGRPNNRKISVYARDTDLPDDGFTLFGINGPETHDRFRSDLRDAFAQEVEQARRTCHSFVISNEHLHSRITSDQMVARLGELFGDQFDEIRVICCLRPQIDLLVSHVSVAIRNNHRNPAGMLDVNRNPPYYDYLALWNRWRKRFPDIEMIPFKRCGDIIETFARIAGVDTGTCSRPGRVNEKLDYRTASLIWNLELPRFIDGKENKNKEVFADRLPVEQPITLGRARAIEIQSPFEAGNAELAARCDEIELSDLTPDFSRYPEAGTFEKIFEPLDGAPMLREMIVRLNIRIWMERTLRHITEAERALARHKPENAVNALRHARNALGYARQARLADAEWATEAQRLQNRIEALAERASTHRETS